MVDSWSEGADQRCQCVQYWGTAPKYGRWPWYLAVRKNIRSRGRTPTGASHSGDRPDQPECLSFALDTRPRVALTPACSLRVQRAALSLTKHELRCVARVAAWRSRVLEIDAVMNNATNRVVPKGEDVIAEVERCLWQWRGTEQSENGRALRNFLTLLVDRIEVHVEAKPYGHARRHTYDITGGSNLSRCQVSLTS